MFTRLLTNTASFTSRRVMSTVTEAGPVESAIRQKLTELLKPTALTISNDSWQHRNHAPMRAAGGGNGETHFSVDVVSSEFSGKRTMQRHRMIYSALSKEFADGLHSLSLNTKTPQEAETAAKTS